MSNAPDFPPIIKVGILVFEGFEPLDVWGFVEAFAISRFLGTGYDNPPAYPFEIKLISNQVKPPGKNLTPKQKLKLLKKVLLHYKFFQTIVI